jgi:hypothetical protein
MLPEDSGRIALDPGSSLRSYELPAPCNLQKPKTEPERRDSESEGGFGVFLFVRTGAAGLFSCTGKQSGVHPVDAGAVGSQRFAPC